MSILLLFSFIGGFVTILSPCILPLLPIILASGTTKDKYRPQGIVIGFILSFTFFTLALATLVKATGISADALRGLSIIILFLFGLTLTIPRLKHWWELLSSRFTLSTSSPKHGAVGGILIGFSLGLIWTPCVGPILASVITLAASSNVTSTTFLITLVYSLGTAIPLYLVMRGSSWFMSRFNWLKNNSETIQQGFGLLMIATSLLLYFQLDRRFQSYIINRFPSYGAGLTKFEENEQVTSSLEKINKNGGNMTINLKNLGAAPEITEGGNWLNSDPLNLKDLRGKVVLVDFWTYSCINCIRTLPYIEAWHNKYKDDGLVVIGIHSPEFEFEKNLNNLKKAAKDFDLTYPIVQDNDFKIWRAYNNHYWPAKYLIDKEGVVRMTHFGEGDYDETEMAIQELLGEEVKSSDLVNIPSYTINTRSPETYLGYWRIDNLISSPSIKEDVLTTYSSPEKFSTNGVGFVGNWIIHEKHAESSPGSSLKFRFEAKNVHIVMSPTAKNNPSQAVIKLDGQELSIITIDEDKLYDLIKLEKEENHYLEIIFPQGGVDVYAFTFG